MSRWHPRNYPPNVRFAKSELAKASDCSLPVGVGRGHHRCPLAFRDPLCSVATQKQSCCLIEERPSQLGVALDSGNNCLFEIAKSAVTIISSASWWGSQVRQGLY